MSSSDEAGTKARQASTEDNDTTQRNETKQKGTVASWS
jgi:hypothetical protein